MLTYPIPEGSSLQYQDQQVFSTIQRSPVSAEPFRHLEYQVEGVILAAHPPGRVGPQPYPTEDGLYRVAGWQMHPVFLGIMVKAEPIADASGRNQLHTNHSHS